MKTVFKAMVTTLIIPIILPVRIFSSEWARVGSVETTAGVGAEVRTRRMEEVTATPSHSAVHGGVS